MKTLFVFMSGSVLVSASTLPAGISTMYTVFDTDTDTDSGPDMKNKQ